MACHDPLNRTMYIWFLTAYFRLNPNTFILDSSLWPRLLLQSHISRNLDQWEPEMWIYQKSVMQHSFLCFELPNSCISTQSLFQMHNSNWIVCGWMTWLWSWACWWCLSSCSFPLFTSYWEVNGVGKLGNSNEGCTDIQKVDFRFFVLIAGLRKKIRVI